MMRNCISAIRWNHIVLVPILILLEYSPCHSQSREKILFLRFEMKGDSVSLMRANVRPGHLKPTSANRAGESFRFTVLSARGDTQWVGMMEDPGMRRLEYEDPLHPGKMIKKIVQLDKTQFTIRIPMFQDAKDILFFRPNRNGARVRFTLPERPFARLPLPQMEEIK